jgi:hypothetical protein
MHTIIIRHVENTLIITDIRQRGKQCRKAVSQEQRSNKIRNSSFCPITKHHYYEVAPELGRYSSRIL